MVEVREGMMIPLTDAKSGTGAKGDWFLVPLKAEKGSDRITVWALNPQKAKTLVKCAKVARIGSVKLSARQYQDKWYPEYSVNAVLEQGEVSEQEAFEAIMREVNDDDLPFA